MDVHVSDFFLELANYLPTADELEVLDLGVGDGTKVLLLARPGLHLTGVDLSEEAIKKFKESTKSKNIKVEAIKENIKEFKFTKFYDVIIVSCILHYFDRETALKIINNVQNYTKPEGFNLVIGFTVLDPGNCHGKFFFEKEELKRLYANWKILKYLEFSKLDNPHVGYEKVHTHHLAGIITRKNYSPSL
jgi:tellurite methyltransferase